MQLGSLADIVTALTAIGALFAAILGAKHAGRLFAVEAKRDDANAARERQAQARQVFAWVAARTREGEENPYEYGVVVANASDQIIYDVEVGVLGAGGVERTPVTLRLLPPGVYYLPEKPQAYGWGFASPLRSFEREIRPVAKAKECGISGMTFRDSSNLTWARDEIGLLSAC